MRYDSLRRREGDLQKALTSRQDAQDSNPNHYIWRRRIQQYGPRLDKPYPFYELPYLRHTSSIISYRASRIPV